MTNRYNMADPNNPEYFGINSFVEETKNADEENKERDENQLIPGTFTTDKVKLNMFIDQIIFNVYYFLHTTVCRGKTIGYTTENLHQ